MTAENLQDNEISICFAIDEKFVKPCAVTILSVLNNSKSALNLSKISENVRLHLLRYLKKISTNATCPDIPILVQLIISG